MLIMNNTGIEVLFEGTFMKDKDGKVISRYRVEKIPGKDNPPLIAVMILGPEGTYQYSLWTIHSFKGILKQILHNIEKIGDAQ